MSELRRFRAVVEYDGSDFAGYQRQPDHYRTVQGELERSIAKLAGQAVTVWAAGRTDSGVHATGQVIAFDLDWRHRPDQLLQAVNRGLPADVALVDLCPTAADFNPRFGAKSRRYRYIIERSPSRARRPLTRKRKWQIFQPLELGKMQQAADLLVGEHDFATFGTPPQGNNTVRELFVAKWTEAEADLNFEIEGTAFLYRMVRSIVGSLKLVGTGRWSIDQFETAFRSKQRKASAGAAPAHGLYLIEVKYE